MSTPLAVTPINGGNVTPGNPPLQAVLYAPSDDGGWEAIDLDALGGGGGSGSGINPRGAFDPGVAYAKGDYVIGSPGSQSEPFGWLATDSIPAGGAEPLPGASGDWALIGLSVQALIVMNQITSDGLADLDRRLREDLDLKANLPVTIADLGFDPADQAELDAAVAGAVSTLTQELNARATKAELADGLALKRSVADSYTKAEVDTKAGGWREHVVPTSVVRDAMFSRGAITAEYNSVGQTHPMGGFCFGGSSAYWAAYWGCEQRADWDSVIKVTLAAGAFAGGTTESWAIGKRPGVAVTTSPSIWAFSDGVNGVFIFAGTVQNPTLITSAAMPGGTPLAAGDYWLRFRQIGNNVTSSLYTSDPDAGSPAPLVSVSTVLTGSNATAYGAGVLGSPSVRILGADRTNGRDSRLRSLVARSAV